MTDRDTVTSALAGPLVNARATSAGVAPCAPTPGKQEDRLRQELPRLADRARVRRADDGADAREAALADDVVAELGDETSRRAARPGAVRQRQVLDVGATCDSMSSRGRRSRRRSGGTRRRTARASRVRGTCSRSSRRRVGRRRCVARGRRPRTRARCDRCRPASRRRSRARPSRRARTRTPPRARACHPRRAPRSTQPAA